MSLDQTAAGLTATPIDGPQPILSAQGLQKRYGKVVALDNADFELMPGKSWRSLATMAQANQP